MRLRASAATPPGPLTLRRAGHEARVSARFRGADAAARRARRSARRSDGSRRERVAGAARHPGAGNPAASDLMDELAAVARGVWPCAAGELSAHGAIPLGEPL